jgi:hypothetical protein
MYTFLGEQTVTEITEAQRVAHCRKLKENEVNIYMSIYHGDGYEIYCPLR